MIHAAPLARMILVAQDDGSEVCSAGPVHDGGGSSDCVHREDDGWWCRWRRMSMVMISTVVLAVQGDSG
ncbi:hypothetical protein U1Q18_035794 [Sarracenia purpurea var. burkii]